MNRRSRRIPEDRNALTTYRQVLGMGKLATMADVEPAVVVAATKSS